MSVGRMIAAPAAALSCALALLATPASAADYVLRMATISDAQTPSYAKVLEPFARAVERDSGGRIEVALKPLGNYGKPADLFNMVEKGDIEIANTVQGYNPGRFPQSSVMELPLMFDNAVAGSQALWGLYKEGLLDKDYASVKVLSLYVAPPFSIFTTGKKIASLRELRGMRVRSPGPTVGLALAKLGAIPLGIPVDMIGESIANGTVDAIAYSVDSALGTKGAGDKYVADQLSVLVDAAFASPAQMLVMNRAKWDSLPPDLQAVIEKNTPPLLTDNPRIREEMEQAAKKKIQADPRYTFVALTEDQRAEMQRLVAPAIDDWKASMAKLGIDGEKLLARAHALVQQFKVASN